MKTKGGINLKRIILIVFIGIVLLTLTILNIKDKPENKITVAEVTHSVFYAPWYVALEKGYFEDIEIEVILTSGANNVIAAVLSNDANIVFCGPEGTIYAYKNDNKDTIMSFAALTKRDGQFLVLRNNIEYKNFKSIENLTILAGRSGVRL